MSINYNIRTNYKICHLDSNKTETLTIKQGCVTNMALDLD